MNLVNLNEIVKAQELEFREWSAAFDAGDPLLEAEQAESQN